MGSPFTGKPVRSRGRAQSLRLGWGKAGAEKVGGRPRKGLPWEHMGHERTSKSSLSYFIDVVPTMGQAWGPRTGSWAWAELNRTVKHPTCR